MGKAGRKPKAGERQPNGQLKRPTTQAALNQLAADQRRREQAVVLSQPHRRGEADPLAESPLGRLCLRMKLRKELYDAGMTYASVVKCWRAAKGAPQATGTRAGRSGAGPDDDTVHRWQTQMLQIKRAVTKHGRDSLRYLDTLHVLDTLVLDEEEVGIERDNIVVVGLQAIAAELGLLKLHAEPFTSVVSV